MATFDAVLPPFDVASSTILITGASQGIGLGLVDEFSKRGAKLLITGRREAELQKVQSTYPNHVLKYYISDASKEADRIALHQQATTDYPQLNVLINNAGIQRRTDHTKEIHEAWSVRQLEIDLNFAGPVHLTSLFIPHLLRQRQAAVIFNTGGVAFMPVSAFPVYTGTKAAVHQYALALRPLLTDTNVRIVEAAPPAVKSGLHPTFGEDTDEYCRSVVDNFVVGKLEFGYKGSEEMRLADRQWLQQKAIEWMPRMGIVKFSTAGQQ